MSPLSLVLVIFGLLIAVSRAPLIVAPESTRSFYSRVMGTDGRMRSLGLSSIIAGPALAAYDLNL